MDNRWTDDHGPDELYDKFTVMSNRTRQVLTGTDELIFVLRPERDREAWLALQHYASAVRSRSPELAEQLREKLRAIQRENVSTNRA